MHQLLTRLIEPKQKLEKDRQRFTNDDLLRMIAPIVVEQFLALLVGIADTLMISYAGEAAVSGVSLVNQVNNIFIMVFTALAAGGAVVVSQYIGKGDKKNGDRCAGQLVMITTIVSIVLAVVTLLFGSTIFRFLFGAVEEGVYSAGMVYLRITAASFPFLAVYNGCAGLFRSMGKTKTLMNVSIIMNVINVVGNSIGIFVLHAGVRGVAYPSLISRIVAAIIMLYLALDRKNKNAVRITADSLFSWDGGMIKRIFSIAVPNSVENGLFQIAKVALSSIVALFGTAQIAANGVAQSFWSMAALFVLAMGPAFTTVIGQCMGAGDVEASEYYNKKLLRMTYLGGVLWNLVFFLITPLILQFYSLSAETVRLIMILVIIHNTFNALFCPLSFALSNGLRAAGDAKFTMYSSIFTSVIVRVVLSVLFGKVMQMGVIGIALAMASDWGVKALLIAWRYKSGRWKQYKII